MGDYILTIKGTTPTPVLLLDGTTVVVSHKITNAASSEADALRVIYKARRTVGEYFTGYVIDGNKFEEGVDLFYWDNKRPYIYAREGFPSDIKRLGVVVKRGRAWIVVDRDEFVAEQYRKSTGKDPGLQGLPITGQIPMRTAQRALKRLGSKAKACKITPALLREGMDIEREHRDVTGGSVMKTAKIAAAHICERRDYYKRIKRYVEK